MTRFKRLRTLRHRLVACLALLTKPYGLNLVTLFGHHDVGFGRVFGGTLGFVYT